MVILLLVMLAFVAVTIKGAPSAAEQCRHLDDAAESLASRIAKLDDLHATGTVAADVYHVEREELKRKLASVIFQRNLITGTTKSREAGDVESPKAPARQESSGG